jgi:hypothetical protein
MPSNAVATIDQTPPETMAALPLGLQIIFDDKTLQRIETVAARMSKAQGIVPSHLLNKPEACFSVILMAAQWRLDPFAVARCTYQFSPNAKIGYEGKLVRTILESSGKLDGPIKFEHFGDWTKIQGNFEMRDSARQDGDGKARKYAQALWKPQDEKGVGVRVIAQLKGELEPRTLDFYLAQAQPRNSTIWASDPMTQIKYTAVRRFADSVVPHLMLGVPFDLQEAAPIGPDAARDITPSKPDPLLAVLDVDPETGEVAESPGEDDEGAGAEQGETSPEADPVADPLEIPAALDRRQTPAAGDKPEIIQAAEVFASRGAKALQDWAQQLPDAEQKAAVRKDWTRLKAMAVAADETAHDHL